MTTLRGEIARSEPERTNEQLTGKVWLAQGRNEWPVRLMTSPSEVIHWLNSNPDGAAWEYMITPVRRVMVVNPDPFLMEMSSAQPEAAEPEPEPAVEMESADG